MLTPSEEKLSYSFREARGTGPHGAARGRTGKHQSWRQLKGETGRTRLRPLLGFPRD